ncbi:hypothetical protein [Arthrobacter sp. CDRTa11]|uniref:hypothetical protein n=1 Tax=Arthrobacter sp. CDRTa11 TaxID=2651199 RepID=UPI002265D016|nr:hypothetical protein [Arthrobacter sp. CDRTa11]
MDRLLEEGAQVATVQRRPLDSDLERHPRVLGIQADVSDSSAIPGAVNIRCNAIAPGWISSHLSETYVESQADFAIQDHDGSGAHRPRWFRHDRPPH